MPTTPASRSASHQRTGTLQRGLAVLDVLAAAGQPLGLAEVAHAADLDLSTALRLLRTLEEAQQVLRVGDGKRYIASPKTLRPLPLLHPIEQLRREADPILRELAAKVAKTVVLVIYLGEERLVVEVLQTVGSLSPYYTTWLHGPLHASGPGKALLLTMDEARRRAVLGPEPYTAFTTKTRTTWAAVAADLAGEERGVLRVNDEFYDGLSSLSVNFLSWNKQPVGCIAITGHTHDFDPAACAMMSNELVNCARLMPLQAGSLKALDQLVGRT